MANQDTDPPATLAEAEIRFNKFLTENAFPSKVRWIVASQIALTNEPKFLIQHRGAEAGREEAERRYLIGVERGLGICLRAICVTVSETIASVYIPTNLQDAQYHMMAPRLKLSCPVERLIAVVVNDVAERESLGYDTQLRSKTMREDFEL